MESYRAKKGGSILGGSWWERFYRETVAARSHRGGTAPTFWLFAYAFGEAAHFGMLTTAHQQSLVATAKCDNPLCFIVATHIALEALDQVSAR
jgi:hypothetical protein